MKTLVWIDWWQHRCCGNAFEIGSTVRWEVLGDGTLDQDFLREIQRDRTDLPIAHEDHHAGEVVTALVGTVLGIDLVDSSYTEVSDGEVRGLVRRIRVPGSTSLTPMSTVLPSARDLFDLREPNQYDGLLVLIDVQREEAPIEVDE